MMNLKGKVANIISHQTPRKIPAGYLVFQIWSFGQRTFLVKLTITQKTEL